MRASILIWSALSGAVMGLIAGAALFGVAMLVVGLVPSLGARLGGRWLAIGIALLLVALPAAGAVLGWLEGRLKLPS